MRRILVVEDDPDLRSLLGEVLTRQGNAPVLCGTAEEAEAAIAEAPPDLALLDINLPGEHGVSLAWRLRQRFPALPLIVTSACLALWDASDIEDCGVDLMLEKPLDLPHLLAEVERLAPGPT